MFFNCLLAPGLKSSYITDSPLDALSPKPLSTRCPRTHTGLTLPLAGVAFQCDSNQLASGADARLLKEILKGCFYGTLGYSQLGRDLLVAEAFENTAQNFVFAVRKEALGGLALRRSSGLRQNLHLPFVEPGFTGHHLANGLRQQRGRVVLQENTRYAT